MSLIKTKEKGSLIVISGPSGAGKNTVIQELLKINDNIWLSISETSRPLRGEERNGVEYYFDTKEEFQRRIKEGKFLEFAIYNGNYYGTPKDKINEHLNNGEDVILEIEIQGALKVKELVPEAIFIFILPPSLQELKRRLIGRKTETQEMILNRFKIAYNEINEVNKYNYVVVNDDAKVASSKIAAILTSEKCRVDRIEEVYLNNIEEEIHELLIDKDFINIESEF